MLTISKSTAVRKLQHRHLGAIAVLILISLLSLLSGLSLDHNISNAWDGLLWGIADPVLHLDSLLRILGMGLISTGIVHGSFMTISFVIASILGLSTHLLQFNLLSAEIAIAVSSIVFGTILVIPHQPSWVIVVILGAIAGLFQGTFAGQGIDGVATIPILAYIVGVALTQYAVVTSARQIISDRLSIMLRFVGFAVMAIGIVFGSNLINF